MSKNKLNGNALLEELEELTSRLDKLNRRRERLQKEKKKLRSRIYFRNRYNSDEAFRETVKTAKRDAYRIKAWGSATRSE